MHEESGPAKRAGRPSRVTSAQIAEAALAIGLDRASIRNVAKRLDMSVPGLYHHVRTREELLAIAAAHSLGALQLPDPEGITLEEWLDRYARFVFDALVRQPELIGQIVAGSVNTLRLAQHLERFLGILVDNGWDVDAAYRAYAMLSAATIGAAVAELGDRSANAEGRSSTEDLQQAASALGDGQAPRLAQLTAGPREEPDPYSLVQAVISMLAEGGGPPAPGA